MSTPSWLGTVALLRAINHLSEIPPLFARNGGGRLRPPFRSGRTGSLQSKGDWFFSNPVLLGNYQGRGDANKALGQIAS
jgi:hypothetical protein